MISLIQRSNILCVQVPFTIHYPCCGKCMIPVILAFVFNGMRAFVDIELHLIKRDEKVEYGLNLQSPTSSLQTIIG